MTVSQGHPKIRQKKESCRRQLENEVVGSFTETGGAKKKCGKTLLGSCSPNLRDCVHDKGGGNFAGGATPDAIPCLELRPDSEARIRSAQDYPFYSLHLVLMKISLII